MNNPKNPLVAYALAIISSACAAGITFFLEPFSLGIPFLLFFASVMISARFGGLGPGLLSVAFSALFVDYFTFDPVRHFTLHSGADLAKLALFVLVATLVVLLSESLGRLQRHTENVLRSIADGFCSVDGEGTLTYVNQEAIRIAHWEPSRLKSQNISALFPPARFAGFHGEYSRALASRQPVSFEDHDLLSSQWLEFRLYPSDEGLSVYFREITARKRTEQALQDSEIRFRTVAQTACDAILLIDQSSTLLFVNRATEQIFGYPPEQLIGQNLTMLMPGYLRHVHQAGMNRYLKTGKKHLHWESIELPGLHQSGREIPLEVSFGEFTRDGVHFFTGFARDISERKRVLESLRESEENFRRAQQAAQIGSYVWDLSNNHVTWNAEVPSLAQVAPDGKFDTWMQHVLPEDLPLVFGAIEAMKDGGEHFSEARVLKDDGSIIWIYSGGRFLFNDRGQPTHGVGIAMDITSRKLAEEQLRSTEKLAATGRLAATIAHEINNPLESITNLHFLLRGEETLSPGGRRYLELAEREVARVAHIARQTLGFYRGNSVVSAVNLPEMLDDILSLYRTQLENRQISIARHYECKREIQGMKGELRQVLSNLVSNAIDAMTAGGRLTVSVKDSRHPTIKGVQVGIQDDGEGISPQNLPRVFEAFFTTKKDVGTGLGLWVTKGIVESQGGIIEVQSSNQPEDHGTCFSIILPFDAQPAAPALPSRNAAPAR